MMSLFKLLIFFILALSSSTSFALDVCNMNGDWFDPTGGTGKWFFQQDGVIFSGPMKNSPSNCHEMVSGTVNGMAIAFVVVPTFLSEACNFRVNVTAVFMPDCMGIQGQWTYIKDGQQQGVGTFSFLRNPIKIVEPVDDQFVITSEPQMPKLTVRAAILDGFFKKRMSASIPIYTWGLKFTNTFIPKFEDKIQVLADDLETDESTFQPDFKLLTEIKKKTPPRRIIDNVVGGQLTLSVEYYKNIHDEKQITLLGTNPGQKAIEKIITDPLLRKIACQESRYRQFNAKREGGIGYTIGTECGVGIMQLCSPDTTSEQAWNWRENLKAGIALYKDKHSFAVNWPKHELGLVNEKRKNKGLPACNSLPPFNAEQLEKEIIRLYNCGHEYQWEPWDDPDCKGSWVSDPPCKTEYPLSYDPDYINHVLNCDIDR